MWSSWARTSRTPLTQDVDTTVTGTQAEMCCLRMLQLLPTGMRSQPAADGHRRKNTYIHSLQEKHTRREPGGLSVKGPMSPVRWKGVSMGQMRMMSQLVARCISFHHDAYRGPDSQAGLNHHLQIGKTFSPTLCDVGSSVEVTVQLRETDMCLLHTGFLCNTTEPVTTSPVWTGTGSSIINKVCFQCVVGCSGPVLSTC